MMKPALELYSHVENSCLSGDLLRDLARALEYCLDDILKTPRGPDHVLGELETVEISIVDDQTIADIHARFLNDPSATDVITFPHGDGMGELIISLDTAFRQAATFGEPWERELFRYMVHGLLHLQGYLDATPEERSLMFSYQEPLVLLYSPWTTA
ncbi:rRNA maturation RNase YbeY [Akkermansia sp. N21116]|uniref:rRNA maturation RNase YbeY n=1 Tax=Akkermansia sp. N21116 TaxID=3040764 RepID=UPI00244EC23B|nr:rRNA maturation RNase YbeY [Akkermansia sp. N21116]WPX41714.1 rRNA maturation RNase YbeY [Akkermansia sp. N21116]